MSHEAFAPACRQRLLFRHHVRGNNLVCVYWPCSTQQLFAARWVTGDQTQGSEHPSLVLAPINGSSALACVVHHPSMRYRTCAGGSPSHGVWPLLHVYAHNLERGVRFARGIKIAMAHINTMSTANQSNTSLGGREALRRASLMAARFWKRLPVGTGSPCKSKTPLYVAAQVHNTSCAVTQAMPH